ncbi:MAG: YlmC/YmxH family sporulation protein [Clostridium sp.]|nr:YlmC/YmxH family sporulation protein [Clostridium sp.]
MEENLNSINAMKTMEVIDINTGSKLGFISDIKIDCEEQKILSILLPGESKGWFSKIDDVEVLWKDIVKIGIDVILVDAKGRDINNISE